MLWFFIPAALGVAHASPHTHHVRPAAAAASHRPMHASVVRSKHSARVEAPPGTSIKSLGKDRYLLRDDTRGYVLDLSAPGRMRVEIVLKRPRKNMATADERYVAMARLNRERRWVLVSSDELHHLSILRVDQSVQSADEQRVLLPRALQFLAGVLRDLPKPLQGRAAHSGHKALSAQGSSVRLPQEGTARIAPVRDRMRALLAAEGTTSELDKDGDLVFQAPSGLRAFVALDSESPEFLRVATQLPHDGDVVQQRAACNDTNLSVPLCKCIPLDDKTTSLNAEQLSVATSDLRGLKASALAALQTCRAGYEAGLKAGPSAAPVRAAPRHRRAAPR